MSTEHQWADLIGSGPGHVTITANGLAKQGQGTLDAPTLQAQARGPNDRRGAKSWRL